MVVDISLTTSLPPCPLTMMWPVGENGPSETVLPLAVIWTRTAVPASLVGVMRMVPPPTGAMTTRAVLLLSVGSEGMVAGPPTTMMFSSVSVCTLVLVVSVAVRDCAPRAPKTAANTCVPRSPGLKV
jgi:hypothetical protein